MILCVIILGFLLFTNPLKRWVVREIETYPRNWELSKELNVIRTSPNLSMSNCCPKSGVVQNRFSSMERAPFHGKDLSMDNFCPEKWVIQSPHLSTVGKDIWSALFHGKVPFPWKRLVYGQPHCVEHAKWPFDKNLFTVN